MCNPMGTLFLAGCLLVPAITVARPNPKMLGSNPGIQTGSEIKSGTQAQPSPQMPSSVTRWLKRLARAKTITYTVKRWGYDEVGALGGRPDRQIYYVQNTYEVKAQRPNKIAIRTSGGMERVVTEGAVVHKESLNEFDSLYVNNGKQSITRMPQMHIYTTGKGVDALSKAIDHPCGSIETGLVFSDKPLEGCRLDPKSLVPSSTRVIYVFSDPQHKDYEQRIVFDRKTGDLIQASYFERDDKGVWKEGDRDEFESWDFDSQLPATTFNVRPPQGYVSQQVFMKEQHIPAGPAQK